MSDITIQFSRQEHPSLQIGDIAYYATVIELPGGFTINENGEDYVKIGDVIAIQRLF